MNHSHRHMSIIELKQSKAKNKTTNIKNFVVLTRIPETTSRRKRAKSTGDQLYAILQHSIFLFNVYEHFACLCAYESCKCLVWMEARQEPQVPRNWNYAIKIVVSHHVGVRS